MKAAREIMTNENDIQAWNQSVIRTTDAAQRTISSGELDASSYYKALATHRPELTHEAEMYLGKRMDEAREQMMVAAFGTKAGINIILKQVSAFCNGQLKLKDLIGHCQMDDSDREEVAENFKAGFVELTNVINDGRAFDDAKQAEIITLMQKLDLGIDFVLMVVRKLQMLWAELKIARARWADFYGVLSCTEDELLKNLRLFAQNKKCRYIKTQNQYDRYMNAYQAVVDACERIQPEVGDVNVFESTMKIIDCADDVYTQARSKMIEANLSLVYKLARRFCRVNMPKDDLVQEGTIGLMRAVEKYDYRLGHKFSTYATWWIKQSITRAYADQARTVRVPIHLVDIIRRINAVAAQIERESGHEATSAQIAAALNLKADFVEQMQQTARQSVSMDAPIGEDEDTTFGELQEDTSSPTQIDILSESDMANELNKVLGTLTEREEKIVRMRYGIGYDRTYTLEELGQIFKLTRERIRQIEVRSVSKLTSPAENSELILFRA